MKILFNIGHPAHVHMFKNLILKLEKNGHLCRIATVDKEVTINLLKDFSLNYDLLAITGNSLFSKAISQIKTEYAFYKIAKSFNPDILISGPGGLSASHVGKLINKPSIIFDDTEHSKIEHFLMDPFATVICTPSCYKSNLNKNQIRYEGYHELAYLHPNYFKPNPAVLEEIGLSKNDNFFLVRFSSFSAFHDVKSQNFKKEYVMPLIEKLEKEGRIIITSEKKLDKRLEKYQYNLSPSKYHDLLYYAKMYVGESSTSAEESAILGTPSLNFERIIINGIPHSFGELSGVLTELEMKYGLVYCFHNEEKLLQKLDELLNKGIKNTKQDWIEKSLKLLRDKIDVTQFMLWFIENYPESFKIMKNNPDFQNQFKS
jgi:uncharacterized protein